MLLIFIVSLTVLSVLIIIERRMVNNLNNKADRIINHIQSNPKEN